MAGEAHEQITQANREFMKAFGAGDSAGVARCHTQEGEVLPPQGEAVRGRASLEGFGRSVMDMGVKGIKLETAEVSEHDGGAVEVGRYTLTGGDGNAIDRGKYLVVWQKDAGEWKLHRDI